jgi:hypothetical protein
LVASSFPSIVTTGLPVNEAPVMVRVTDPPCSTLGLTEIAGRLTGISNGELVALPGFGFVAMSCTEPDAGGAARLTVADNWPLLIYEVVAATPPIVTVVPGTNPAPLMATWVVEAVNVLGEVADKTGTGFIRVRVEG